MIKTFEEAEEYILNIPRFAAKHSMEETKEFLAEIGDVSESIPTIHIAGTNGKGSVCAYLRDSFLEAGLTPGVFTSPHLVDIRERFTLGREMISREEFLELFLLIYERINEEKWKKIDYHPSYFEYLFFMAAAWFRKKKPDVIILETGLGGRLDATNSVSSPKLCIITEIGFDHMEYLGNTIEEIAGEKAGIIKPGVPVVYMDKPLSGEVFKERAIQVKAPYKAVSKECIKDPVRKGKGIDFSLHSVYYGYADFSVDTGALYQAENGALAFYGLETLAENGVFDLGLDTIKRGFSKMHWPGRMEEVLSGIYLDGAHNEDGIGAFLESVRADGARSRRLVYSAVSDKNIEKIVSMILSSGLFKSFYVASLKWERGADSERLKACFKEAGDAVSFYEDVSEAFKAMRTDLSEGETGYVTGSLYLVGKIEGLLS